MRTVPFGVERPHFHMFLLLLFWLIFACVVVDVSFVFVV